MKTTAKLLILASMLVGPNLWGQSKYYYNANGIDHISKYPKHKLMFKEDAIQTIGVEALPEFLLTQILIPLAIDNIPKLFYNPKKYIKEHAAEHIFDDVQGNSFNSSFPNQQQMVYQTLLYETENDAKEDKDALKALELIFTLGMVKIESKSHTKLALHSVEYNYTPVKLRSHQKAGKVNLVVELLFSYINQEGDILEYTTEPFNLKARVPDKAGTAKPQRKNMLILPHMQTVLKVEAKVTEVNARKKHMDKWLEVYGNYKDKFKDFVIEQIEEWEFIKCRAQAYPRSQYFIKQKAHRRLEASSFNLVSRIIIERQSSQ